MGRAYAEELELIPRSFEFASRFDVSRFHQALRRCAGKPMITIGSGGSYSAAALAAGLHSRFGSGVSHATTPLNITEHLGSLRGATALVYTASGSNPDVVGSTLRIVDSEPDHLIVVCGSAGSPLGEKLGGLECVDLIEAVAPGGKDGFLATNSLMISSILTLRAYEALGNVTEPWPGTLDRLLCNSYEAFTEDIEAESAPLWKRPYTTVLHGPYTRPGAADVESKFSEAALSAVQMVDLRNFAHGRHVWLSRRDKETGVVALFCDSDEKLVDATLRLLPESVPTLRLEIPNSRWRAGLTSIVAAIVLTGAAGKAAGVDPGKPGVPLFGRRLYNLRAFPRRNTKVELHKNVATAITRKAGAHVDRLSESGRLNEWIEAHDGFCSRITSTPVTSVVLDFDGTLCSPRDRFEGIGEEVAAHLIRLIEHGVRIAIATGRGSSVRKDLQQKIPEELWPQVTIGYYNGGIIGTLDDSSKPKRGEPTGCLADIASIILHDPLICQMATVECRASQLSLTPKSGYFRDQLFTAVSHLVDLKKHNGIRVVVSSHALDILAPGVTKRSVIESVARAGEHTLAIGDCGRWPGNDYALLSHELSLSCLDVSSDPETCWNVAPPGCRGIHATLWYLSKLRSTRGRGAVKLKYTVRGAMS